MIRALRRAGACCAALGFVLISAPAFATGPYYCTPDEEVGFVFKQDTGQWLPQTFATTDRYMVRDFDFQNKDKGYTDFENDKPKPEFGVFSYPANDLMATCYHVPDYFVKNHLVVQCKDWLTHAAFNYNFSKFELNSTGDYLIGDNNRFHGTPAIILGHCEPFVGVP
jgi:hypothetical protein